MGGVHGRTVPVIFFDLETTNLDYGSALNPSNRVIMVSWCEDDGEIRTFVGDIMQASEFWQALDRHETACAFNAKFEIHWLKRCGYDVDRLKWHDPMLGEKVLLGNEQLPMNLGDTCSRYGLDVKDALIDAMMKGGICPSEMPQKRLRARCVRDVRTTRTLMSKILRKLRGREQLHLYRNRCDFAVVLAHIEANGMLLDSVRVANQYSDYSRRVSAVKAKLDALTGGINMRSPDQKADFLYSKLKFPERRVGRRILRNKPSKKFPDGRPKTDAQTIVWLGTQAKTAKQKEFIRLTQEFSKVNAALTKNLQFFKGVCDERGGQFHAQFNQTVAATHRLTSSGMPIQFKGYDRPKSVQFQNMPREFKSCFTAPDGYVVCEIDAMQLEFRVAAFLGQDTQAMADIADPDFDAHCRTAAVMQEINYATFLSKYRSGDKQFKAWRQEGKPDTFKPLYGGTKGTPAQERYYKSFAARYSGVAEEQEGWLADVVVDGELTTAWGMRFTWDTYTNSRGMVMNKKTHKPVGPQVFNYPVQNLATAEIVPIAITALYKACKIAKLDVKFVNTIHDSVICYVKDDEDTLRRFQGFAELAFTEAVYVHLRTFYGVEFNVPLGMEMVTGSHWNEGVEHKFDDVENWKKRDAE